MTIADMIISSVQAIVSLGLRLYQMRGETEAEARAHFPADLLAYADAGDAEVAERKRLLADARKDLRL